MTGARAEQIFRRAFGEGPSVIASAPGRVNLIGEHTDYNGGQVLPMAIGLRTSVAMGRARSGASRAISGDRAAGHFTITSDTPAGAWWDYVHGVLRELRAVGVDVPEVVVAVASDVPPGAGLSSSAALEVAVACAALSLTNAGAESWRQVATVAHRAETGFVGVACGIMDQTVSAHAAVGHALRIWCDTGRREQVPFDRTVLVFDTASPRNLRASEFNTRQAECATALAALRETDPGLSSLAGATMELVERTKLPTTVARRARHVVTENQRVEAFVRALRMGEPLGGLLFASHQSLRDDYECSTPELDWAVEQAMGASGIEGARLTGAGWGGCAIIVGGDDALRALDEPLRARFAERWRRTPRTWWSRAAAGAAVDGARLPFGL